MNIQNQIPKRGQSAQYARSGLLSQYNDIDIYIEDTKKGFQKLYINLLSRHFGKSVKINDVNPLGPRDVVIKTCKNKVNEKKITRPSLFIIDGDLYLLKGESSPLPKGVFRLPRYSIENILLDEKAIIEYLNEEHTTKLSDEIGSELDFKNTFERNKDSLINLFIHYALAQTIKKITLKTIKFKIKNFLNNESKLCDALISSRTLEFKTQIINNSSQEHYDNKISEFRTRLTTNDCQLLCHISGKDYLFPLLMLNINNILTSPPSNINFVQRLALKCNIDILSDINSHVIYP